MGLFDSFDNLDTIPPEAIASRLKNPPQFSQLANYLANKILYPQALPMSALDMQLDLAILSEALSKRRLAVAGNPFLNMSSGNTVIPEVPARIRIEKDVLTRVNRVLKGKGSLNVNMGQEVTPAEIIGTSMISPGFRILDLAVLLEVTPTEAEKYLARSLGQRIYQGELLASRKGWLGRTKTIISPTDGVLDFLNTKTGELRISFLPKKVNLPAGVYGIVEKVDKDRGQVSIRTQVHRIHGLFGSGWSREGILHILGKQNDLISKSVISPKYEGQILVGGSLFFKEAITSALSAGVNGVISGGMNADDFKGMAGGRLIFPKELDNDIGISVVVCEGFGSVPMSVDIFGLLQQHEGRFVFIDGNKAIINLPSFLSSSLAKVKNTKLAEVELEHMVLDSELKVGLRVRIVGNSYLGEQGTILAIDNALTLLPSGIKTNLATIETPRRKIQVPVANLEIIM